MRPVTVRHSFPAFGYSVDSPGKNRRRAKGPVFLGLRAEEKRNIKKRKRRSSQSALTGEFRDVLR